MFYRIAILRVNLLRRAVPIPNTATTGLSDLRSGSGTRYLRSGYRTITNTIAYRANEGPGEMETPFDKMQAEGEPKCAEPTLVAKPQKEEQDLPKLSAQEFRVYNRMAEHMDMFVRFARSKEDLSLWFADKNALAQPFPPNLEPPLQRLQFRQEAPGHVATRFSLDR